MNQSDSIFLSGDVDAIKDFVFETSALPQIRGASQLLIECEDAVEKALRALGGEKIYCAGGSFLFKIPATQAEEAKAIVESIYLERTLAATVSVACEPSTPFPSQFPQPPTGEWAKRLWGAHRETVTRGEFARRVAFLGTQVREAKSQRLTAPFFEAPPFGKRCDTCGKRVAEKEVQRHEPAAPEQVGVFALCPVCLRRHNEGVRSEDQPVRGKFNQEFLEYLKESGLSLEARQPPDLDHLVASARRHKYLAFLYADGNEIGRLLQRVRDEKEFKALSNALRVGAQTALFVALRETCEHALDNEKFWPFEIVNVGGDDVTLLIQAGYAWEVGVKFLKRFEDEVKQRISTELTYWPEGWPERITAACGIAIADPKYPIRYLERLADDLLKKAKREAKANPDDPQSALTFLWLPTSVASESADPLMAYYERDEEQLCLTARPYTLERAKKLMELVQQASLWPRALRHRWGEALEKGVWVSLNTVYYDIARREEKDRVALQKLIGEVGELITASGQSEPAPLWKFRKQKDRDEWYTALLDVLELAELRATRPDVREEEEM